MADEKPVIDLEPRNPFSWRVVLAFLVAWLVVFGLVWWLKSSLLRLLLPALALLLVLYLGVCTLLLLKNRNRR